jgi:hypothetical protein
MMTMLLIIGFGFALFAALGVITIPDREKVRPTTSHLGLPNTAKVAMQNPCPVRVSLTGAASSGTALVEPTTVRDGYYGYNVRSDVPMNSADDEAAGVVRRCIVGGFAGVEPGKDVFVDPTARPVGDQGTFSGLTQTVPATPQGPAERIGVGVSTTKIFFD